MTKARHARRSSADRVSPHALRARPGERASAVRARLRGGEAANVWDLLCVVDAGDHLLGTLTAQELASLPDDTLVEQVMRKGGPQISPTLDQEEMASLVLHHGVTAVPVVDAQGRLVGVVGPQALMSVLRSEHVEDLHRLAGITSETAQARAAFEEPPLRRARHRLPWLMVGLVGSALATLVVSRFETVLATKPALAFFIPGLVYLADAIGTQSEAVTVRGLSLSRVGFARMAGSELRTGMLIGLVLALLAFPMIWFVFGELRLALAVSAALASASTVASVLGLILPWLLNRIGLDPAYGSGPLATIVQDVLSLLIYFAFVSFIIF
ncbi:MAG: magnesium transporter [Rhizobacter sp.]|nr:magnesium transporter [Rhizobacter sp.]